MQCGDVNPQKSLSSPPDMLIFTKVAYLANLVIRLSEITGGIFGNWGDFNISVRARAGDCAALPIVQQNILPKITAKSKNVVVLLEILGNEKV